MSTLVQATQETTNAYVQTVFNWESTAKCETHMNDTHQVAHIRSKPESKKSSRSTANPMSAPAENVRQRRVGCEHVGSALATVLGGYGISIDALISEIERLKSAS
jgi:hypothetical protein